MGRHCDETVPECYQCISSGKKCPGPLQGTLFVDMSEPVRLRVADTKTGKGGRRNKPQPILYATNGPAANASATMELVAKEAKSIDNLRLPTVYQPEKSGIFQQLYLAHFISSHDTEYQPWVSKLPHILSLSASLDRPEVYAIRATTMAFYGRLTADELLQIEASKWYSEGLKAQRQSLPLTVNNHGDESYTQGAFIIALTRDVPSVFASERWCTVPFLLHPKTPYDRLVDLLLQLPGYLPIRNAMRSLQKDDPVKSDALARCLTNSVQHLLSQLDDLWQEQMPQIDPDYDVRFKALSSHVLNPHTSNQPLPYTTPFQNSTNAYFASMYDAGNIIALGCLAAASPTPQIYKDKMIVHGASILNSAGYHQSQGCYNGGSFSMIFPVKLVCLLSPSEALRAMAQKSLLIWGSGRGLLDIVEIGEPSFLDRSHG
ncbi:hypothetical protein B7463_g107, partial [Scytalidium lignicola]